MTNDTNTTRPRAEPTWSAGAKIEFTTDDEGSAVVVFEDRKVIVFLTGVVVTTGTETDATVEEYAPQLRDASLVAEGERT